MRKRVVALMVPTLYNGGAEKVAADMSIFLTDAGYKVYFFLDAFDKKCCYRHKGREIVINADSPFSGENHISQFYHCSKRARQYYKYKKRYRIDISISFMVEENLINVMSDIGDKKVLTMHSVTSCVEVYKGRLFAKPYVLRKICSKAEAVIAVSKYVKWDLEHTIGISRGIVDVIYNSVNIAELRKQGEDSIGEKQNEKLILYVGRLDDEKRPWLAIRAMREVIRNVSDAKLIMLGKGRNKDFLIKLIKKWNLEDYIELAGFEENVAKYMAKAKVIVSCSDTEAFPCSIEEALALGLPVVVADCLGGIKEIITSGHKISRRPVKNITVVECGVITPTISRKRQEADIDRLSREEKMFAEGICMLLKNEKLREQLSQNARKRVNDFEQEQIKKRWLSLLKHL